MIIFLTILSMFFAFMLCNFSVRMLKYFHKNFKIFFCLQKVEKTAPKCCILMAVGSFFPLQPRTSFLFHKFFYPTISARISGLLAYKKLFIEYNAGVFDNLQCLIMASGILTEDQLSKIT